VLNADILAGNAARQWLLIGISHAVLYCVKKSISESVAILPHIGLGAGNFLGLRKIFAQIFPNLPEKFFGFRASLCANISSHTDLSTFSFGMTSKKRIQVILHTLGTIFDRIFRQFARIFWYFGNIFTDFHGFCTDFARIFDRSKLLGVSLHTRLLHHCFHKFEKSIVSVRLIVTSVPE